MGEIIEESVVNVSNGSCRGYHKSSKSGLNPQSPQNGSNDGKELRIDSELLNDSVGGEKSEVEIMEDKIEEKPIDGSLKESPCSCKKLEKMGKATSSSIKSSAKTCPKGKTNLEKPPIDRLSDNKNTRKQNAGATVCVMKIKRNSALATEEDENESALDNPDLGPFLLKHARDLIASGDNTQKALELALRAGKSFEICANGKPSLELVMCLHVTAAIYCTLGQYNEAIPTLEQSIQIPLIELGQEHALSKFSGYMQLGDTYAMLGMLENSITSYTTGLEIQKQVLGETDPRVGETCRYLAEAHVQALQFDEAKRLCQMALDIHKKIGSPASLAEAADRRLMGLICETKGDHEAALEHLVLASMAMVANGQESEVASVDCSIGDAYLSMSRYDEAIFAYQKALTVFKTTKGENHPSVGSVFIRLANLYNKTGKISESKSYCGNALRIYEKPLPGVSPEEIACGLTDISAIYESMNELDQALKLLHKSLKIYNHAPGHQSTIAGIEAQIGVMSYMLDHYSESYNFFKNAISKLRASGEKKSAFFGIALNQMGLACIQLHDISTAVELFEEARTVLEQEYGPYHPDTLGVYRNLAGTYDAIGRWDDAIELLEYIIGMREEKLGTANPDVDDEKRRLAELLKEAGRVGSRSSKSLQKLLVANKHDAKSDAIEV